MNIARVERRVGTTSEYQIVFQIDDQTVVGKTNFKSAAEAEASLLFYGYVRIPYDVKTPLLPISGQYATGSAVSLWAPADLGAEFTATIAIGPPQNGKIIFCDPGVRIHVIFVPRGFGFRFARNKGNAVDSLDSFVDPVFNILTTGLIKVQAIGTWSTFEAAEFAAEEFFERVLHMVGGHVLLRQLLKLEDRKHDRETAEFVSGAAAGATGATGCEC